MPVVKPNERDLHWAAGFLEGEGCFTLGNGYMRIVAAQKEPECLERLEALFGGTKQFGRRDECWVWALRAQADVPVVLDWLYPLLSSRRRKRIDEIRKQCRTPVGKGANHRKKTHCPQGHPYDTVTDKGWRRCSVCNRESARRTGYQRYHSDPEYREALLERQRIYKAKKRQELAACAQSA